MSGTNVITPITIGTGASKTTKDPTTWAATQQASVDTTGLNIPGMTGMQTYAQLFQAIQADALHGTSGGQLWGRIRPILTAQAQNYTKKELATKGWLKKDASGLQAFLTGLHNTNAISKTAPLTALSWIGQKANDVATTGKTTFTAPKVLHTPSKVLGVNTTASSAEQIKDVLNEYVAPRAKALGSNLSPTDLNAIAKQVWADGTYAQANIIDKVIGDKTNFAKTIAANSTTSPLGGTIGATSDAFKAIANNYGITVPTNSAQFAQFVKEAVGPGGSTEAFTEYAKKKAIIAHPEMAAAINAGATVKEYTADAAAVDNLIANEGLNVSAATRTALVNHFSADGWSASDPRTIDLLTKGVDLSKPQTDAKGNPLGGAVGVAQSDFAAIAADYGIPLPKDPKDLANFINGAIGMTGTTAEKEQAFTDYAKNQAKGIYHWMSGAIDAGVTVKNYLTPYATTIANTLGIAPDSIDWTDSKWNGVVAKKDPTGVSVPQTLDQALATVKTDPRFGYDNTMKAKNDAYDLASSIKSMFGMGQ